MAREASYRLRRVHPGEPRWRPLGRLVPLPLGSARRDRAARAAHGLQLGEVVVEEDVSGCKKIAQRELGRLVEKIDRARAQASSSGR